MSCMANGSGVTFSSLCEVELTSSELDGPFDHQPPTIVYLNLQVSSHN